MEIIFIWWHQNTTSVQNRSYLLSFEYHSCFSLANHFLFWIWYSECSIHYLRYFQTSAKGSKNIAFLDMQTSLLSADFLRNKTVTAKNCYSLTQMYIERVPAKQILPLELNLFIIKLSIIFSGYAMALWGAIKSFGKCPCQAEYTILVERLTHGV